MVIIGGRAHSLEEIHAVGRLGYPFAEISLYDPGQVRAETRELLELQDRYGISYLAHFPNEGNPFDVDRLRDSFVPRMESLIELAAGLGIAKGTFHFWLDSRWIVPEKAERKIELIWQMDAAARERGIVLCLENLSEKPRDFLPALERVPGLMMTLDIGHAQLLAGENTSYGFVEQCFSRIAHLHVHDNRGGKSVKDDLHLPLGEGIVDYPAILALLKKNSYSSTITMEVKPEAMAKTRDEILKYLGSGLEM